MSKSQFNTNTFPTKTEFNLSEAARVTGKSRTTLRKYIKNGKLSKVATTDNRVLIDASELTRVFGSRLDFEQAEVTESVEGSRQEQTSDTDERRSSEVELLREQLNREISERQRERDRYEEEMQQLHEALKRAQEGQSNATRLLENKSESSGDWQNLWRGLESRMTNHEKQFQRQTEQLNGLKAKNDQYKRALAKERAKLIAEQNKPFLRRLFGE